jgi:hypothetical protein
MTDTLRLTRRDYEIVDGLGLRVRVFSQRQIADHWFGGEVVNARRRLKRLSAAGLTKRLTVYARPLPPLVEPQAIWRPGENAPDLGPVAYALHERWRLHPPRQCAVWIATERAAQLLGGMRRGELARPIQVSHDLGLAAVWLRLREVAPQLAASWQSEDSLAHTRVGQKLPDAFIFDANEQVTWVIEFGGAYDRDRLQAFHADCLSRRIPYQIW